MADFNEHVLKVRAALDKASQQEMREAMRRIFTDESHIDFNNPENIKGLRALADAMAKIFTKAGNTKFDFSKMIQMPGPELFGELKKAALEFDTVWRSIVTNMGGMGDSIASGISSGVDSAIKDAEAKLEGLFKTQAEKMKQIEELSNKQRRKEEMMKRLDFDNAFEIDAKIKYTSDEDLKKQVREIESVYEDALDNLMDAVDNDKVTEPVLQKFKDAAQEMLKVRNTIEDLTEKQIRQQVNGRSTFTNKAEALFGSSFVNKMLGDDMDSLEVQIGDAMDVFTELFDLEDIVIDIENVEKELKGIEREIENITAQHPELISRKDAAETEERLNKIHEAYERLFSTRDSKTIKKGELKEKDLKHIENSLAYTGYGDKIKALPKDASDAQLARQAKVSAEAREKLENAFRLYDESTTKSWEVRAQYLIKAVAEYESILNNPNASKDILEGYESQYRILKDQAVAEREQLEAVVNMARSHASSAKTVDADAKPKIDDDNQRAQINDQIEDSLKTQRTEAAGLVENINEATQAEENLHAALLKNKDIIAAIHSTPGESGAFFNTQTGEFSDVVEGGAHSIKTEKSAWKKTSEQFDTRIHKHNYDVAAPSFSGKENDFNTWIKGFDIFKRQMILANTEILSFDFSKLDSVDALQEIARKYQEAATVIYQEFNGYISNRQVGDLFGTLDNMQEQMQVRLREALENIMVDYAGVMTSIKLPTDMIKGAPQLTGADKRSAELKRSSIEHYDDAKSINAEANARRENAAAIKEEVKAQEELNKAKQEASNETFLYESYRQASDDAKTALQEYLNLFNQSQSLKSMSQGQDLGIHNIYFDATEEQLNKVVSAWKEYRSVIQEISSIKVVDTEDDEKRLMELKAKAVSLYNTFKQGRLNDSTAQGYAKHYGVSTEDAIQMRSDMDIGYNAVKDFNDSLAKLSSKGGDIINVIQNADQVLYNTLMNANNDDLIRTFNLIKENAFDAKNVVDGLNESLEKNQQLMSVGSTGSGAGDASSADLEAERAKVEALQNEIEQKNAEIATGDAAIQEIIDEKLTLQNDLDIANEQIKIAQDSEVAARARADEADLKLIEKDAAIQNLEAQLAKASQETVEAKGSVDTEELKNILNAITYNVKVVQDGDEVDNKITIDETSLEATLTKVFANILNPQTQQNDSAPQQPSWALESTLQTVKGVLDGVLTNTAKIGMVNPSQTNSIAGSVLDNRLVEIKIVLDSINQKIAKGGVIATRGAVKQANAQSVEPEVKAQAARSNMIKSLTNDYKTLGKLAAQFASDGNLETKAMLDNLKEEISRKRQSLKLTMDENASLREKYSMAFDAEKRLLDAEKAQKEVNKNNKEAETTWKKQVKDAQRATGINAATSAANAGDQTVLRAIGTNGITNDIENKAKELSDQIRELRKLRDEIDKKGNQASDADRDNLSKQITKVKELKTEVDGYLKIHEKYSGENVTDLGDASGFGAAGTDEYWNNITEAIKNVSSGRVTINGLDADTGELTGTTKIAANTFAQWSATVDPITGRLSMLRTGIKKTETLMEQITRKTREIFTYFSGSSIIFKAFNEIKKGVQYVRDIDLALTELKKVTDETEETYDRFLETAAKTADKVGSTIKDVVSSTADWARLGYSMEQAAKFAETTQILMNVSEFTDVSRATDTLISSVQAFGYTAETSMDVVDLLNTIGNNYAISTADLAQSLTKSSASLVAAGGDLAEAAALTATANKIIQDADSVGTALKTTSLRLRGTDVSVLEEEGLDSDGAVTSKSKLRSKVQALSGVDILTQTGEYKSTYEILSQIADVWESINNMDQAALLELISGKRNASVIAAILQNPEELKAAFEDANNASGSALKENEKYLDSIQGKIDQFNNAVQSLWSNLLDSDIVKGVVEFFTDIVKSLNTTQGKILGIVKAVALLMAYKKINPLDWITKFGNISNAIKTDGLKSYIMSLFQVSAAQKTVTADTLVGTIAQEQNNVATQQQIISKLGLTNVTGALTAAQKLQAAQELVTLYNGHMITRDLAERIAAMLGYKFSVDSANNATVALDTTTKSFMASNPVGWILLIVSAVVSLTMVLSNLSDTIAETEEAAKETLSTYHQTQDTLRTHKKTIEDISDDYKKLADGVDDLGRNVSLSTDEYERYNEITNKIAEMFPDMISGYTNEGNAIIALKGNVEALTAAYEEEARAARDAILVGQGKVYEDFLNKTTTESGGVSWNDHIGYSDYMKVIQAYIDQEKGNIDSMINLMEEDYFVLAVKKMKEDLGFSANDLEWEASLSSLEALLRSVQKEANAASAGVRTVLNAYLQQNWDYINLTNEGKNIAQSIISGFDTEFYSNFASAEEMEAWVSANVIQPLQQADNMAEFTAVFDIQTQFNDGKISVDEYINRITEFTELLKKLGFDEEIIKTVQGIFKVEDYETKKNSAMEILDSEGDSQVGKLSKTDLDIIDKNKTKWKEEYKIDDGALMTWDDLLDAIQRVKDGMWEASIVFDEISEKIDGIQDAYSALTDAVDQYNEYGYLTLDNLQALLSLEPEYLALLQMENGQLTINQAAMEAMIQTKLDEAKATAVQSAITQLNALAARTEADEINNSANAAANAISGLGSYADSLNIVTQNAIGAAGAISAFNTAVAGAQGNQLVDQSEIDAILSNLNNQINLIDSIGANLGSNFNNIVSPDTSSSSSKDEDDAFQREMDYWENRIAANQAKYEQLQNEIDLLDKKGQKADASYYEEQIKLEGQRLKLLNGQKDAAKAHIATLEEGSEEWWEVANTLNDIEGELDDVTASIVDLQDAIGEIDAYKFEEFGTRVSNLADQLETVRNLLADEDEWFSDEGEWTEDGIAALATYIQELEIYKDAISETGELTKELNKYQSEYAGNEAYYETLGIHSEQEYYDKFTEIQGQYNEYLEMIDDTEQAVVDMYESNIDAVEEYIDTLVDSYNDYIDSVKEALDAERELFDFKKNVQKQAKDIAELERRIASLSGSENAADIAERRKLEAQLYESRESLNDTYYDHAKDAQNEALDAEQEAYETAMTRMVENMRISLEEATVDMAAFLDSVTIAVSMNADTVLAKYRETEVPLNEAITNPWKDAAEKAIQYGKDATNLMDVWKADGYFAEFKSTASTNLTSPWNSGTTAANAFKTGVNTVMNDVVDKIATNVKTASGELSKLYQQIITTEQRAAEVDLTPGENRNPNQTIQPVGSRYKVFASLDMGGKKLSASGVSDIESRAKSSAMLDLMGKYEAYQKSRGISESVYESSWLKTWKNRVKFTTESTYAKGTTGTKRDEWAITDEPQFGDELVLVPGKNGNLSFMRKGTGVVPADMTQKLWELAQIPTSELMNKNLTAIVPNITKNDFKNEFNFESLVHVDTVDSDTLPQLEKMVDKKIDDFSKALNYSLKRFTR